MSGNWWPVSTVGWTMHTSAVCLFVGSYSAILGVAVEGCVGLTEVLAAGVVAKTWVGLDISG